MIVPVNSDLTPEAREALVAGIRLAEAAEKKSQGIFGFRKRAGAKKAKKLVTEAIDKYFLPFGHQVQAAEAYIFLAALAEGILASPSDQARALRCAATAIQTLDPARATTLFTKAALAETLAENTDHRFVMESWHHAAFTAAHYCNNQQTAIKYFAAAARISKAQGWYTKTADHYHSIAEALTASGAYTEAALMWASSGSLAADDVSMVTQVRTRMAMSVVCRCAAATLVSASSCPCPFPAAAAAAAAASAAGEGSSPPSTPRAARAAAAASAARAAGVLPEDGRVAGATVAVPGSGVGEEEEKEGASSKSSQSPRSVSDEEKEPSVQWGEVVAAGLACGAYRSRAKDLRLTTGAVTAKRPRSSSNADAAASAAVRYYLAPTAESDAASARARAEVREGLVAGVDSFLAAHKGLVGAEEQMRNLVRGCAEWSGTKVARVWWDIQNEVCGLAMSHIVYDIASDMGVVPNATMCRP